MTIHIQTHINKRLLSVYAEGEVTNQELDDYYDNLKQHRDVGECTRAIIDISAPDSGLKFLQTSRIRSIGRRFRRHPLLPKGAKMAIVVRTTMAYGFVRMFMISRGDEHLQIKPFRNLDEAQHWLGLQR